MSFKEIINCTNDLNYSIDDVMIRGHFSMGCLYFCCSFEALVALVPDNFSRTSWEMVYILQSGGKACPLAHWPLYIIRIPQAQDTSLAMQFFCMIWCHLFILISLCDYWGLGNRSEKIQMLRLWPVLWMMFFCSYPKPHIFCKHPWNCGWLTISLQG